MMKKLAMLATVAALAFTFGGSDAFAVKLKKSMLEAYASTSGAGGNSGRIWSAKGKQRKIGKFRIVVKASWNWSFYNADHPAALINTTTKDFEDCRTGKICAPALDVGLTPDYTQGVVPALLTNDYANGKIRRGHPDGFRADATVTITTKDDGDVINGAIIGGSVYEIAVPSPSGGGSVNEWFISFNIVGGTGEYASATGTGYIHMIFDSGGTGTVYTDVFDAGLGTEVYQSDPARFLRHTLRLRIKGIDDDDDDD